MNLSEAIKDKALQRELVGYVLVGFLGVVVDFGAFYGALYFSVPVLAAQWLGSLLGFTHNHIWQHYKVFTHDQRLGKTYSLSLVISVISIILSGPALLALNAFIPWFWFNKMAILGITFVALYLIKKKWIFTKKENRPASRAEEL